MQAAHWLRSRQEERELIYWLSVIAYDPRDRSITNRIYLLYLILFFGIWIFITLTFFASGGAALLKIAAAGNAYDGVVFLQVFSLVCWSAYSLWKALKRSPVPLTEEDAALLCQTPVSRRMVVMRWFWMPWLRSALPFWLGAVVLGFSLAEAAMAGALGANRLLEYSGYGLRAWLGILPVQLALSALHWTAGAACLQKDRPRRWLRPAVLLPVFALYTGLLLALTGGAGAQPGWWTTTAGALTAPVRAGFGDGSLAAAAGPAWLAALIALGALALVSGSFNLSRAAQETADIEKINAAGRYGFESYSQELKTRRRLGITRAPFRLAGRPGAAMLAWKDILQSYRTVRLTSLLDWAVIIATMAAINLLPDLSSTAIAVVFWMIRVGKVSVTRLRSDLACWPILRQLPVSPRQVLLYDLGLSCILVMLASLAGALITTLTNSPSGSLSALLPGITVGAAGMAAFDVIKSSRKLLFSGGPIPDVGARGILLGMIFALPPVLIHTLLPGAAGWITAVLASILLGWASIGLAERAYRKLEI